MIITKIRGGLGNQLFQYAAGRYLAHKHNTKLKLDLNYYNGRNYAIEVNWLDKFNTIAERASDYEIDDFLFKPKKPHSIVLKKLRNLISPKNVFSENGNDFSNSFYELPDNTYLDGYFQSEKYFYPIKDIIRNDLNFRVSFDSQIDDISNHINSTNSVGILVRRGDYFNDYNPVIILNKNWF